MKSIIILVNFIKYYLNSSTELSCIVHLIILESSILREKIVLSNHFESNFYCKLFAPLALHDIELFSLVLFIKNNSYYLLSKYLFGTKFYKILQLDLLVGNHHRTVNAISF